MGLRGHSAAQAGFLFLVPGVLVALETSIGVGSGESPGLWVLEMSVPILDSESD